MNVYTMISRRLQEAAAQEQRKEQGGDPPGATERRTEELTRRQRKNVARNERRHTQKPLEDGEREIKEALQRAKMNPSEKKHM